MTAEFTINVAALDAAGKEYRFEVRPAWVLGALEDHEAKPIEKNGVLDIRASKSGHDVVVHGTLDMTLTAPCARCLEPATLPIHSDISVLYVPSANLKAEAEGEEVTDAEADTFPFDGDEIVLDDLVRDELVLGVPMIPLCSESCTGMSPAPVQESGDKPVDPRLAPLLAFSAKKPKGA